MKDISFTLLSDTVVAHTIKYTWVVTKAQNLLQSIICVVLVKRCKVFFNAMGMSENYENYIKKIFTQIWKFDVFQKLNSFRLETWKTCGLRFTFNENVLLLHSLQQLTTSN